MKFGGAKANALIAASILIAGAAIYLWVGFDRSTYYTDHDALQRDADTTAPRNILWRDPEPIATAFDTPMTEADPAIDASGTRLYFTRVTERGDTDLYYAERDGAGWGEARPLIALNTLDNESGPQPAPDGTLVFASDRPGSLGGFDLWQLPPDADEPVPFGPEINSPKNERGPTIADIEGTRTLLFASDRGGSFDLYRAALDVGTEAAPIASLSTDASELAPAVSPSGDFMYYASDAEGGAGGFDLYRARFRDGIVESPERLDEAINTPGDELEPALALEGFALLFARSIEEGGETDLRRAISREVELATSIVSRGLLARLLGLLPWLLVAIAIAMLLAGLRRMITSGVWGARVATLGLLARCAAFSIAAHAALLALLSLFAVEPMEGDSNGYSRTRVTIASSSAARDSLADQLHGETGSMPNAVMATPEISPASTMTPTAQPTETNFETSASVSANDQVQANASASLASPTSPQSMQTNDAVLPESLTSNSPSPNAPLPSAPAPTASRNEATATPPQTTRVAVDTPVGSVPAPDSPQPSQLAAEAAVAPSDAIEVPTRTIDASNIISTATPIARRSSEPAPASSPVQIDANLPTPSESARTAEANTPSPTNAPDTLLRDRPAMPSSIGLAPATTQFEISRSDSFGDAEALVERSAAQPAISNPTPLPRSDLAGSPTLLSTPSIAARLPGASPDASKSSEPDLHNNPITPPSISRDGVAIDAPNASPDGALESDLSGDTVHIEDRLPATTPQAPMRTDTTATAPPSVSIPAPSLSLASPAVDPVLPTPGLIEHLLRGIVLDASTGNPIAEASIRLDRHPAPDLLTESATTGRFELAVEGIPDTAAVTASAHGYVPQSLNITDNDVAEGIRLTFALQPIDATLIALEPEPLVRHLGNDEFSGTSNSRFQRESEGISIEYRFRLDAQQVELIDEPAIAALFKGVDVPNPVFINGQRIGVLEDSPRDGTFAEQTLVFDGDLLRRGVNRLRIEATSRPGTDIDDFEFVNPRLLLQSEGDALAIRGTVVDGVTGEPLPGATVRLDRAGAPPLTAIATAAGSFRIRPSEELPDQFAIVATHPGYVAGVAALSREDIENGHPVRIALEPASPLVIAMEDEPIVHHLGNDEFAGRINSQFQRASEGIDKAFTFSVPTTLPRGANDLGRVQLWVKGKERPANLSLNGIDIGQIDRSNPDGSFGLQTIEFPATLLRQGENTLTIRSRRRSGDVDDFEFVDVRIVISPGALEMF